MRTTYDLRQQPVGQVYRQLIQHALSECQLALLVVRDSTKLAESGQLVLRKLEKFLGSKSRAAEWPGTTLLMGRKATLFKYEFSEKVAEILKSEVYGLYDWVQPNRPEDLCLLRSDETPWLATIAHEKDAYFELSDEEKRRLTRALPNILA